MKSKKIKDKSSQEVIIAILAFIGVLVAVFALFCVQAWVVQLLINWIFPYLFGTPEISFWMSLGIVILCNLLFKSTNNNDED